jgi:hypothetical protein
MERDLVTHLATVADGGTSHYEACNAFAEAAAKSEFWLICDA